MRCPSCQTEVSASRLSCPACHRLIYSHRLQQLAAAAEEAVSAGRVGEARSHWQEALTLLPPDSRQYLAVSERIDALEAQRAEPEHSGASGLPLKKLGVGAGAVALLAWKLKAILAFVVTKGKLLLLGLGKWPMLFGVVASFGVFWAEWGWRFALGLMVSIYIHELGHVVALRRHGIPASAPMFVPGLGAYVRLKRPPKTPAEDAAIGLEGPLWGLGAAVIAYLVYLRTGWGVWGAIARFGAVVNIFNLIPVWQLDGARGFVALDRLQRILISAVLIVLAFMHGGFIVLVAIVAGFRALFTDCPEKGDWWAFAKFAFLAVSLSYLAVINVGVG